MKRILLSLAVIAAVGSLAVGATTAYFSDTETSTGNTFSAGTLDLTVNGQDGTQVVHVTKSNITPRVGFTYQDYNQQFMLKNVGSIPGKLSWKIVNLQNFENGCNEPEETLGDTTCDNPGAGQGELGQYTWVYWEQNDTSIPGFTPVMFNPLNTANGVTVNGPVLNPGESFGAYMWFDFPTRTDNMENLAQGDSVSFDIVFTLDQAVLHP